jgi:rfaE bifunctional protein kinase chain/domain
MIDISGKKVVIAGDLVADQFLSGTIARVSREAPVFILRHDETETRPGAAANTAVNVASLGGIAVLVGVIGDDPNGRALSESLVNSVDTTGVLTSPGLRTTTKVRVLAAQHYAARQQVIRIDYENPRALDEDARRTVRENLIGASENADAIVLSDYGYGVVDAELFAAARKVAAEKGIPLVVDSRSRLTEFAGATSATPNQEEVEQILGK